VSSPRRESEAPPATLEAWARRLLEEPSFAAKLAVGAPPATLESGPAVRVPDRPARPAGWCDAGPSARSFRRSALGQPLRRAQLLARFAHHELQAAELMAQALLRFGDAPAAFRRGLGAIAAEELEHARRLEAQVRRLGADPEEFPRRDWFWERVPRCPDAGSFCAVMGLGLEAANLEHSELWAARLSAAGDPEAAAVQREIGLEERAHVRFARVWFERFRGRFDFDTWSRALPAPLSPVLLRGAELARAARLDAGFDADFLERLAGAEPQPARR
jgi:uncharacterized ferritin-like protein (DUF455 family)